MKFVVPISSSSYILFYAIVCLIAFLIGMYVLAAVLCIGFIYCLFKEPETTIMCACIAGCITYPPLALPILMLSAACFWVLWKIKHKVTDLDNSQINDNSEADSNKNK